MRIKSEGFWISSQLLFLEISKSKTSKNDKKSWFILKYYFYVESAARLERLSFLREAMPSKKIIAEDGLSCPNHSIYQTDSDVVF